MIDLKKEIVIKVALLVMIMFFFTNVRAATYYFSSKTGDDSRSSTEAQNPGTPWKSLEKLNAFMPSLNPGDIIMFYSGEVFEGSINITKSGTSTQPIIFSAYGTGNKPLISGFSTMTNWVSVGNGIWEASCSSCGTSVNSVVIDGKVQEMGRYPNSNMPNGGYLKITSHVGKTSITSSELTSSHNWNGGEIVTRTNRWIIDRNIITNHSGSTIEFTAASPNYTIKDNYGFFIQNHPATLDTYGEWYYNPQTKKLRVFFGTTAPTSVKVQASRIDDIVTISRFGHISFNNLIFNGANVNAFKINGGQNLQISNCEINFSGVNGVDASATTGLKITNSILSFSHSGALYLNPAVSETIIQGNMIRNTATMAGMAGSGNLKYVAIMINGANNLIDNNQIISTGYNAISFMGGNNNVIKNNFIDTFCTLKDDGSGIYTWNNSANPATYTGQKIINNIIINGKGAPDGVSHPGFELAHGIYIDDNSSNIEISGNTSANNFGSGLFNHNGYNLSIRNNTFYNNAENQILFERDAISVIPIRNISMSNNIFFAKTYDQNIASYKTNADDLNLFGTFNYNYYCRPFDDHITIHNQNVISGKRLWHAFDLAGWQKAYSKDLASKKSPAVFKPFVVNKLLGSNKVGNGAFNSSAAGVNAWSQAGNAEASWNEGGKLDGGAFQLSYKTVATTTNAVNLTMAIGAVSASKNYLVKFSVLGSTNTGNIGAYFRKMGPPYTAISKIKYASYNTSRSEHELLISFPESESNAALVLDVREQDGTLWLDNIEVYEVDVTLNQPEDFIRFEYNATQSSRSFKLTETHVGVDGTPYLGTVTLAPFSSIIMLKSTSTPTPPPANKAPFAHAGANQTLTAAANGLALVNLDGSGSTDPDGSIVSYEWNAGSEKLTTGVKPTISLPPGNHQITLTITDDKGATASAMVQIAIKEAFLAAPYSLIAMAVSSSQINLQWQESNSEEDGFILERSTTSDFNTSLISVNLAAGMINYQDAALAEGTTYYYRVKAKKESLESAYSNAANATTKTNTPPIVDAGSDQSISLPANTASFTATASDADGKIVSWSWTKVSGPAAILNNGATATLAVSGLVEGTYTFEVMVTDDKGATATDEVSLKVEAPAAVYTFYRDADGDGFGNNNDTKTATTAPEGYISIGGDCNDTNPNINPGATEICGNGIDDNCNSKIDEACTPAPVVIIDEIPVINVRDTTVSELDREAKVTVFLSNISTQRVRIDYSTQNGTASHPKDYKKASGSIYIPAGSLTAVISIPIEKDNAVETTEEFYVVIVNPSNAKIGIRTGRITILDANEKQANPVVAEVGDENPGKTRKPGNGSRLNTSTEKLSIQVAPNPSASHFTVTTLSMNNKPLLIKVRDLNGHLLEVFTNVVASGSVELGQNYRRGIYIIEVMQGNERAYAKVIKQ